MTRLPRCVQPCCFATGKRCGCCGKAGITDPAVRAIACDLNSTFRRMQALEARHADSIATLTEEEADHERLVANGPSVPSTPEQNINLAAGPVSAAPFNPRMASIIETLRSMNA